MKVSSTTFRCDQADCEESLTVPHGDAEQVAAHVVLVEKGWKVHRRPLGWKHACPDHADIWVVNL